MPNASLSRAPTPEQEREPARQDALGLGKDEDRCAQGHLIVESNAIPPHVLRHEQVVGEQGGFDERVTYDSVEATLVAVR